MIPAGVQQAAAQEQSWGKFLGKVPREHAAEPPEKKEKTVKKMNLHKVVRKQLKDV